MQHLYRLEILRLRGRFHYPDFTVGRSLDRMAVLYKYCKWGNVMILTKEKKRVDINL